MCLSSILSPRKKVNWLFDTNPIYQLSNHAIPSPVFGFGAIVTVWGDVDVISEMKISRQFLQQINTVSLEWNSAVFALLFNNKWVILYWLKKRKNRYKKPYLSKNKYLRAINCAFNTSLTTTLSFLPSRAPLWNRFPMLHDKFLNMVKCFVEFHEPTWKIKKGSVQN